MFSVLKNMGLYGLLVQIRPKIFSQFLRPSGNPTCVPRQLYSWEVKLHSIYTQDTPISQSRDQKITWPAVPNQPVTWLGRKVTWPRWRAGELRATLALNLLACQLIMSGLIHWHSLLLYIATQLPDIHLNLPAAICHDKFCCNDEIFPAQGKTFGIRDHFSWIRRLIFVRIPFVR